MEIRILKRMAELVGPDNLVPFGIEAGTWRHNTDVWVNLTRLDMVQTKKLKELFEPHKHVRGIGALNRDLDIWIAAQSNKNINAEKIGRLTTATLHFKQALKDLSNHHVYKQEGEVPGAWLAYYVQNIEYHKARQYGDEWIPAYLEITFRYQELGSDHTTQISLRDGDVRGYTAEEVLNRYGYYLETAEFRKKYLEEKQRCGEIIVNLGKQYLGSGPATGHSSSKHYTQYNRGQILEHEGEPGRVVGDTVIDATEGTSRSSRARDKNEFDPYFWDDVKVQPSLKSKEESEEEQETRAEMKMRAIMKIEVPVHPYVRIFHLQKHINMETHVANLTDYVYDRTMVDRLILPKGSKDLVHLLIEHRDAGFQDVVKGKSGGAVVLLGGSPGTGKTLTAEVFAESEEKPLYSIQASQLGLDGESLEENLSICLGRARRWKAVMLIDEADVYVKDRGGDIVQNAIVGVFLRVLEYHRSILFFTTNRPDIVDDAILSRCIAKITYTTPTVENQRKIWRVLADLSKIQISDETIESAATKFPKLSGRDVKNLLKLASLYSKSSGKPIDLEMVEFVKEFKATADIEG